MQIMYKAVLNEEDSATKFCVQAINFAVKIQPTKLFVNQIKPSVQPTKKNISRRQTFQQKLNVANAENILAVPRHYPPQSYGSCL